MNRLLFAFVVNELQHLVDDVAVIIESRHFVLSAQFADAFEPVVEQSFACRHNFELLQRNVFVAFGYLFRVDALQCVVQAFGKGCEVGRFLFELDDPLVSAFSFGVHKHWGSGVFIHHSSRSAASLEQALFGIVDNEFLAKSIDKALGSAADDEFVGVDLGEAHRIANLVTPQSARSGNDDGFRRISFLM